MNYRICRLLLTISSLWLLLQVGDGALWHSTHVAQSEVDACFAAYLQCTKSAASAYAASYEACFQQRRKSHQATPGGKQQEREDVEAANALVCNRLADCNALEDEMDFFQCHAAIGPSNFQSLLSVKFISYAMIVNLEEQYELEKKELLLCTIEAQRQYAEDSSEAYRELSLCLRG